MAYNINDAHMFSGRCQLLCGGAGERPRAFLITLLRDQWSRPIVCTNGKRDTVEACARCAAWWRQGGDLALFRPLPGAAVVN